MTLQTIENMGNEMTTALGMSDNRVILFWKAFEEGRYVCCTFHYHAWKKLCTKY